MTMSKQQRIECKTCFHASTNVYTVVIKLFTYIVNNAKTIVELFDDTCININDKLLDKTLFQRITSMLQDMHVRVSSKLTKTDRCECVPWNTINYLYIMSKIACCLRWTDTFYVWGDFSTKIVVLLINYIHGSVIEHKAKSYMVNFACQKSVDELFNTMWTRKFHPRAVFKNLGSSTCEMCARFLINKEPFVINTRRQETRVLNLLKYISLYDLVINSDSRISRLFQTLLPECMGEQDEDAVLATLSLEMHEFLDLVQMVINRAHQRKLVRLHYAAPGQCTCRAKCSVFGNAREIQLLSVCKTCKDTPIYRQIRIARIRRTISSNSDITTCSEDANSDFIYIPLYTAKVDAESKRIVYEHLAYTHNIWTMEEMYTICSDGSRKCYNSIVVHGRNGDRCCRKCKNVDLSKEETCISALYDNSTDTTEMCDGCIISMHCPVHRHMKIKI